MQDFFVSKATNMRQLLSNHGLVWGKFHMARRGENIRKRKDGRWEGRYIKGRKPDRTAVWGYVYGHSYTEVKKKMTMRKAEVRACALSEQNPTFQELSHNWEGSISLGVKASTITHYQYTLEHYILPVLGDYRVQELDEYTLERSLLEIITPTDNSHKPLGATMAPLYSWLPIRTVWCTFPSCPIREWARLKMW